MIFDHRGIGEAVENGNVIHIVSDPLAVDMEDVAPYICTWIPSISSVYTFSAICGRLPTTSTNVASGMSLLHKHRA